MKTYQQIVRSVYGEPRSSFWSGFSGALNLFGSPKKVRAPRRLRPETEALSQDWAQVAGDLQRAFERARCR